MPIIGFIYRAIITYLNQSSINCVECIITWAEANTHAHNLLHLAEELTAIFCSTILNMLSILFVIIY